MRVSLAQINSAVRDLTLDQVWQVRLHDPRRRKDRQEVMAGGRAVSVEVPASRPSAPRPPVPADLSGAARWLDPLEEVYEALVLGARDYVRKNGFQKV